MDEKKTEGKSFEEKLEEVMKQVRDSEEAYERWLRQYGIDREIIQRIGKGPGTDKGRELEEMFERARHEIDGQRKEPGESKENKHAAREFLNMPAWAVKA